MNDHQRIAIEQHCRFGYETSQRQFYFVSEGGRTSVGLTVNSGYE